MSGSLEIIQSGSVSVVVTQVDTGTTITLQEIQNSPTITVAVPGSIAWGGGSVGGSGATATYTFSQETPLATWTINHDLNRYPSVAVVDSTGQIVDGDVAYTSANQIVLSFSGAFSGIAYLN